MSLGVYHVGLLLQAMKNEPGCQMSCLFVVRGDDQLIVKEIKESSMRLLLDVTTETGEC